MRTFVSNYKGFEIYQWSTGKYEVYLEGGTTGMYSKKLLDVMAQIDSFVESKPKFVKLYTMLIRKIGGDPERQEVVICAGVDEHVMTQFGIPNLVDSPEFNDGTWELVIRPYKEG